MPSSLVAPRLHMGPGHRACCVAIRFRLENHSRPACTVVHLIHSCFRQRRASYYLILQQSLKCQNQSYTQLQSEHKSFELFVYRLANVDIESILVSNFL